jgi:hypothetical protein
MSVFERTVQNLLDECYDAKVLLQSQANLNSNTVVSYVRVSSPE